ncbi:MAG: hypothetical protein CL608_02915 [Anaerolineaceae bacterium]|nr:hypothetical protein [Anaerolineaceae bacterium]
MMRDFLDVEKRTGFYFWLLLILLTAVSLRLFHLTTIPPGLTHDEADHGITAVSILNGSREIYFTVGYGREPLFDYATAGMMALLGQKGWVLRGTAVLFSLLMIGAMTAWTRRAFKNRVALLTAAGLAVGFWPVMAARQGLRSITLPALFTLALYFFWRALQKLETGDWRLKSENTPTFHFSLLTSPFLLAGIFLGLTFYTYIPARGLWLLFPALLLLGSLWQRNWLRQALPGTVVVLLVAGVMALPLFAYLRANPAAEVRIDELSKPLTAVLQGDFSLLWSNIKGGLAIFTFAGDSAWRYNIPRRPLLEPIMGLLYYLGVGLAVWQLFRGGERPLAAPDGRLAYAAALIWLLGGLAPVLITGPALSMTQGMGMQPVLYLFPALALDRLWQVASSKWQVVGTLGVILLFGGTAVVTVRDYFGTWANAPEVRVQYESTMTAVMDYLAEQDRANAATSASLSASISTITPGPFHTPALAQMTLPADASQPRWFDGRGSLLVPDADEALVVFSGFAPLPPALEPYLATAVLQDTLPLRPSDADRPIWVYRIGADDALAAWQTWLTPQPARFGSAAELIGYDLSTEQVAAGERVQLVTVWQVQAASPDLRLFTHVVGPDGIPLAQADRLDAPSGSWVAGDWLVQLHEVEIPAETAVGRYPLTIGLYNCLDPACEQTQRLPVQQNGTAVGDNLQLTELMVTE